MSFPRELTPEEIAMLERQGCTCTDWKQVSVYDPFDPAKIRHVHFSGKIVLHPFTRHFVAEDGREIAAGIYHAALHDCEVGADTLISHVSGVISRYRIGRRVKICDVGSLTVEGENSFGNGTVVNVLDETGGRSVKIFDHLTAHLAYMVAMYRHRPRLIRRIDRMVDRHTRRRSSRQGDIGDHVVIEQVHRIRNVLIGPHTTLQGCLHLEEGSIHSSASDPVTLGPGVIMKHFILKEGSHVSDGVILDHCFVGHACHLGKQFSAEHSLFFSNCTAYHGEACSVFAGPYTVTHHKSTLLIAGMYSFFNAGSGTNQSNHMYKLGPLHHGVMERGSKTASDSYVLWPAKVGAFTVVIGRHYNNSDTSGLPFSYLLERSDESYLSPGLSLRSVGTIRDALKWPARDRRNAPKEPDLINFNLLSPYTVNKILAGREILRRLLGFSGEKSGLYTYENVKITREALTRGLHLYETALYKFLGNALVGRLQQHEYHDVESLRKVLLPADATGQDGWSDLAGLIAPLEEVERLADDIEQGKIRSFHTLYRAFVRLHENYYHWAWNWAAGVLEKETGKKIEEWQVDDVIRLVKKWRDSVLELDRLLYEDARKEFTLIAQTGFGIDGDPQVRARDFEQVRGRFEENPQVKSILRHQQEKEALAERILQRLNALRGAPSLVR